MRNVQLCVAINLNTSGLGEGKDLKTRHKAVDWQRSRVLCLLYRNLTMKPGQHRRVEENFVKWTSVQGPQQVFSRMRKEESARLSIKSEYYHFLCGPKLKPAPVSVCVCACVPVHTHCVKTCTYNIYKLAGVEAQWPLVPVCTFCANSSVHSQK